MGRSDGADPSVMSIRYRESGGRPALRGMMTGNWPEVPSSSNQTVVVGSPSLSHTLERRSTKINPRPEGAGSGSGSANSPGSKTSP